METGERETIFPASQLMPYMSANHLGYSSPREPPDDHSQSQLPSHGIEELPS